MSQPPLSDEEREDLVAFLDGELSGEAARSIEAKLDLDPRYRAEAAALKQTWDMLDFLPQPGPSPQFTRQTVSRIAALRPPAARPVRATAWRSWAFGLGWAASVLLAALLGYGSLNALFPRDTTDEDLSRDLRVIENKRFYERVDDIDFLWQLDHPDLFGDDKGG